VSVCAVRGWLAFDWKIGLNFPSHPRLCHWAIGVSEADRCGYRNNNLLSENEVFSARSSRGIIGEPWLSPLLWPGWPHTLVSIDATSRDEISLFCNFLYFQLATSSHSDDGHIIISPVAELHTPPTGLTSPSCMVVIVWGPAAAVARDEIGELSLPTTLWAICCCCSGFRGSENSPHVLSKSSTSRCRLSASLQLRWKACSLFAGERHCLIVIVIIIIIIIVGLLLVKQHKIFRPHLLLLLDFLMNILTCLLYSIETRDFTQSLNVSATHQSDQCYICVISSVIILINT